MIEMNVVQKDCLAKRITLAEYPQLVNAHKMIQALDGESGALDKSGVIKGYSNGLYRVDAHVVGGAPRDILAGKDIKDVDLFISAYSGSRIASAVIRIVQTCAELGLTPEVEDADEYGGTRITAGNLDMVIQSKVGVENIVHDFDMVSSQAWLEIEEEGFIAHATDLFHELNERKVLGYFPKNVKGSDHLDRISEKYPDYLLLALCAEADKLKQSGCVNDGFEWHSILT